MLKSGNFDTWEEMGLCGQWCKADHCANTFENALRYAEEGFGQQAIPPLCAIALASAHFAIP